MPRRASRLGVAALVCALVGLAAPARPAAQAKPALSPPLNQADEYVPGDVLVKFAPGTDGDAVRRFRARLGIEHRRRFPTTGARHLKLPPGLTVDAALAELRADPDVEYAEPNYRIHADLVPNDPAFPLLWGLHNAGQTVDGAAGTADADIDAPEAWDATTGSAGVTVAVLDSGLDYRHPDLAPNLWTHPGEIPGNGIDDDGNGYVDDAHGWDFVAGDNAPLPNDPLGHGTHVAGTIAAVGNEGWGMAGVSWHARVMPLRVLDASGAGDTARAILAVEYAGAQGARVIHISWGGGVFSQALGQALAASPALVVCAAGNGGADTDLTPHYPASYGSPNILSVAATDRADGLATFSNYGAASVDVAAPGVSIYSAAPGRNAFWRDGFDAGALAGWTTGGTNNRWGITGEQSFSAPDSLADSPSANYADNADAWARTPVLDLTGRRDTHLDFKVRGRSQPNYDRLYVETSTDGVSWTTRTVTVKGTGAFWGLHGVVDAWSDASVTISDLDGAPRVYARFRLRSDASVTDDGWYLDDVSLTEPATTYDGTEFAFQSGTSFAAPHVSGLAALLLARDPTLTTPELKAAILQGVDPLPALAGRVATGGRVNAARSLGLVPPAAPTVSIPLRAGWNLVSWPLAACWYTGAAPPSVPLPDGVACLPAASVGESFSSIAGQYDLVRSFDAAGAHTYDPALPGYLNDLTWVAGGYGYWIRMKAPGTLRLTGQRLAAATPLPLGAGWNLAGYWGESVRYVGAVPTAEFPPGATFAAVGSVPELFPSLGAALTGVLSCDAAGDHAYPAAAPAAPVGYAGPGYGYWLKLGTAASLHY